MNDLDYCKTQEVPCPKFTASEQYDLNAPLGKARNVTWNLQSGNMCKIEIDATKYIGRVLFDNVQGLLGIEGRDPTLKTTTPITFENTVGEVIIYNAAETGGVRFTISFSGATTTMATLAAAVLSVSALTAF